MAIWVGYPDKFKPMETEFQGDPVAGGTYPAGIFKTFMEALVGLKKVKKDTTEVVPAVPPGTSTGAPSDAPTVPDTGDAIEGGGAPPASTPVPRGARPAGAEQRRPTRPRRPSSRRSSRPSRRPTRAERPAGARHRSSYAASFGRGRETLREPRHAEAPGQLGRLGDPDPGPHDGLDLLPAWRRRLDRDRAAVEVGAVEVQADPERLRQLPGPEQRSSARSTGRGAPHQVEAFERLQGSDEDRAAGALWLADRVEERVDAVRAVDVGRSRRPEQRLRTRRDGPRRRDRPPRTRGRPRSPRSRPPFAVAQRRSRGGLGATSRTGRS